MGIFQKAGAEDVPAAMDAALASLRELEATLR